MKGIYKITNKNTGEIYIGQSVDCERRIQEHKKKRTQTIDNYINCLGVENFNFEIIEECKSQEELDKKEQEYIKKYNSIESGYNIQKGGYNNSVGEGNGRALLNEKDVRLIRTAYNNHESPTEVYQKVKHTGISYKAFQGVWQGKSWANIMPEVFTEENKKYYTSGIVKNSKTLSNEDVLKYRQYYMNHTAKETYKKFVEDYGETLKERSFSKILTGDVRNNSSYLEIPIYSKVNKRWELNGEPVSTIHESVE